jgi:ribose-phosphate pyrophosphokinase
MNVIGNVENKNVLLVDDIIDTGGTFVSAIEALKKQGAKKIFGAVTHPLFSGKALERVENSAIETLYIGDTIGVDKFENSKKIVVRTASEIFSEAILRTHRNESISSLFDVDKG